jgi:hypothetical protein
MLILVILTLLLVLALGVLGLRKRSNFRSYVVIV